MIQNRWLILPATALLVSATASASGGGGFDNNTFSTQQIDQQYELGKSYYKARQADGNRLEYCLKLDDGLKKLSRRSVKPFKRGSSTEFVDALYNCKAPEQKIADLIPADQGEAILYYLNKRFKLRLQNS
ncbi:MAG: hypothetical protein AAF404_07315 [Pseudomonadota bacterium]